MDFFTPKITLALTSGDMPLVYQHQSSHLVTSLPYIDEEANSQVMSQVQKLIQDEMKIMPKKDYLANLQLKKSKIEHSQYLNDEFERVKKGTVLDTVDLERYKTDNLLPAGKENDLNSIRAAITKTEQLIQHNNFKYVELNFSLKCFRLINLELLNKYGAASWKDYLNEADTLARRCIILKI